MSWLQPWVWAGALAVALPIAVHLISQRPPRATPFPSLRFLRDTRLRPARHRRPSDWPVLLVRIAIVLAAVAAMAQPVWRAAAPPVSRTRAIIVDTSDGAVPDTTVVGDSTNQNAVGSTIRVATHAVRAVLPGVVAWLRTQPAPRELIVQSAFRRDAVEKTDFAALPADVLVRLVPMTPAPRGAPDRAGSRILVAAAGHDSLATWLTRVQPLAATPTMRWMAERIAMLQRDSLLVSAAWATSLRDTIISAPVQVVATTATGAPVVLATAIPTDASVRLLLWTRTDSTSRVAAALRAVTTATTAITTATGTTATTDELRDWATAPSAPPIGTGTGLTHDPLTAPSDARWLWLLVLILLGLETLVRRRD